MSAIVNLVAILIHVDALQTMYALYKHACIRTLDEDSEGLSSKLILNLKVHVYMLCTAYSRTSSLENPIQKAKSLRYLALRSSGGGFKPLLSVLSRSYT